MQAKGFVIALLMEDGLWRGYYSIDLKRMDLLTGQVILSGLSQGKKMMEVKKLVPACSIGRVISNSHKYIVALKLWNYMVRNRKISFSRQDSGSEEN